MNRSASQNLVERSCEEENGDSLLGVTRSFFTKFRLKGLGTNDEHCALWALDKLFVPKFGHVARVSETIDASYEVTSCVLTPSSRNVMCEGRPP